MINKIWIKYMIPRYDKFNNNFLTIYNYKINMILVRSINVLIRFKRCDKIVKHTCFTLLKLKDYTAKMC